MADTTEQLELTIKKQKRRIAYLERQIEACVDDYKKLALWDREAWMNSYNEKFPGTFPEGSC